MRRWKHYRAIHSVLDDVVEMVIEVGPKSEDSSSSETESSKDEHED